MDLEMLEATPNPGPACKSMMPTATIHRSGVSPASPRFPALDPRGCPSRTVTKSPQRNRKPEKKQDKRTKQGCLVFTHSPHHNHLQHPRRSSQSGDKKSCHNLPKNVSQGPKWPWMVFSTKWVFLPNNTLNGHFTHDNYGEMTNYHFSSDNSHNNLIFITFTQYSGIRAYTYVCAHMLMHAHAQAITLVEITGQVVRIGFLHLPCGYQRSNSGPQVWEQAPLYPLSHLTNPQRSNFKCRFTSLGERVRNAARW